MFESWSDDAMETEAIYFGLGEDAVLLWKEGEGGGLARRHRRPGGDVGDCGTATAGGAAGMRKDVIPVEDAQGGPRSPRRFRLLALLLAAFALLSAVWYFTAYRPYDVYMEPCRQPGGREAPALPGCGTDGGRVTTVMWPGLDFSIGRGIWGLACRT